MSRRFPLSMTLDHTRRDRRPQTVTESPASTNSPLATARTLPAPGLRPISADHRIGSRADRPRKGWPIGLHRWLERLFRHFPKRPFFPASHQTSESDRRLGDVDDAAASSGPAVKAPNAAFRLRRHSTDGRSWSAFRHELRSLPVAAIQPAPCSVCDFPVSKSTSSRPSKLCAGQVSWVEAFPVEDAHPQPFPIRERTATGNLRRETLAKAGGHWVTAVETPTSVPSRADRVRRTSVGCAFSVGQLPTGDGIPWGVGERIPMAASIFHSINRLPACWSLLSAPGDGNRLHPAPV